MAKFGNSQKDKFLNAVPITSIENDHDLITKKCKFNFSYFIKQDASQNFDEWGHEQLVSLLESLKNFSEFPLTHWRQEIRKGLPTLAVYESFPVKTDFTIPPHIPYQALWARFRLASAVRLIGFVIPTNYHKTLHSKTNECFDSNTFYIVFLDLNHRFYKTEKR